MMGKYLQSLKAGAAGGSGFGWMACGTNTVCEHIYPFTISVVAALVGRVSATSKAGGTNTDSHSPAGMSVPVNASTGGDGK